jgi:hypothetical protein
VFRTSRFALRILPVAIVVGGLATAAIMAESPATAGTVVSVTGGIKLYQKELTGLSLPLGNQASPTTVATKSVPAGTYLVHGFIGLNAQPGSFIVCALSNVENGNDGIFGVYANQTAQGMQINVAESEAVTVSSGQAIHLTCDDNNGKSGDVVGEAVIEAIPVNALH